MPESKTKLNTMIVPDGNLDAVAIKITGSRATSKAACRPAVDPRSFDVQRTMAPGGDLDAINLNAVLVEKNERADHPIDPASSFRSRPAGDEINMTFWDRKTFVDSGPKMRSAHGSQPTSRSVQTFGERNRRADMAGFRFRDGTDDDPPLRSDNFHDGEERVMGHSIDKPDIDPSQTHPPRDRRPLFPNLLSHIPENPPAEKAQFLPQSNDHPALKEEAATYLDVSTAQLEIVIRRIMERVFVDKVEAVLQDVLERAVDREMKHLREMLVTEMKKNGAFSG